MADLADKLNDLYKALEVANVAVLNSINALRDVRDAKEIDFETSVDLTYLLCDIMEDLAGHSTTLLEYADV